MKKDKLPDGFPVQQDEPFDKYPCDNCGKVINANETGFDAFGLGADGHYHNYTFCSDECVFEFAGDNDLEVSGDGNDDGDYEFYLQDKDETPEGEIDPEDVGKNGEEPDIGEKSDDPKLVDEKEASSVPKKKITECWAEVVERAKEIAAVQLKIVETNETLKYYKKEYDSLVKKQNDYILTNGNGIQLTFEDCDPAPVAKDETPETLPEEVDPDAWKKHSVRVLQGFTAKQMEKIEANFSTLGAVQEWACKENARYRSSSPGQAN